MDRTGDEPTDAQWGRERGPSDPDVATPHASWVRVVALVVLAVFLLATLVGALLL